jgi:hypothetical protein
MLLDLGVLPMQTQAVSKTCLNIGSALCAADRQLTRSEMCVTILPDQLLPPQPVKKAIYTLWDPHVHYRLHNSSTTCPTAKPRQSNPRTPLFSLRSFLILYPHLRLGVPVCSLPFLYRHSVAVT